VTKLSSTTKKEWNYLSGEKIIEHSSFAKSISDKTNEGVVHPDGLFFRFSFLMSDFIAINFINFVLIQVMGRVTTSSHYLMLFIMSNVTWIISSYITALYFANEGFFKRTFQAFLLYSTLTLLFIFIYKFSYSRLFVMLSFSGFAASLMITRTILIGTQHFLRNKIITKKVIILGCNDLSQRLANTLSVQRHLFNVHGYFDDAPENNRKGIHPVLGSISESLSYALLNNITEMYSTIPPESNPAIYEIAQQAEKNFIRFKFVPDFKLFINRRVHIGFENDIPVLSLRSEPLLQIENRFKKRLFDIIFSSIIIFLLLSWLLPIIAILIKIESRGPVFFKQLRSGKNNKPFLCFKFRSLRVNNEADSKQVTHNDKRFTRIGKFLRKTNLDELPQFFNVLQGYMSIVGPRPHMLKHTEEYSNLMNQYMVRHFVKPGVTGWAQINGYRGEIKREEQLHKRVEHDIAYMENWSMWFDLRIIFLTVYTTLRGDENAF